MAALRKGGAAAHDNWHAILNRGQTLARKTPLQLQVVAKLADQSENEIVHVHVGDVDIQKRDGSATGIKHKIRADL